MAVKKRRQERASALLRNIVSTFIKKRMDDRILVSIMRVEITNDLERANIFISVFPEEKEKEILNALKRLRTELREYLKTQLKTFLPFISFEIDKQIKIERKINELLK
jgi:ribosome-binding factor A